MRERLEDAKLLALKVEEGDARTGCQQPPEVRKSKETGFPLKLPKGIQSC